MSVLSKEIQTTERGGTAYSSESSGPDQELLAERGPSVGLRMLYRNPKAEKLVAKCMLCCQDREVYGGVLIEGKSGYCCGGCAKREFFPGL